MDGEELTEQETQRYDRQIRVWGADAQRRLSKAHILVCGIKGTVAEFCKNIVLAGVASLTLVDDRVVSEEILSANFLVPFDENFDGAGGKTLSELCCDSLKDFNPMVCVTVEKGDLTSFGVEFYEKFDVVVVSSCSVTTKKLVNEKCRKLSKRIAFYSVDCRDSCGEIFVDLNNYKYAKKKLEESIECELQYSSFEEAISVPWKAHPRRVSKLFYAFRVIENFEEAGGCNPVEVSNTHFPLISKIKKDLCESQSMNESFVSNVLLERLATCTREFPPVCAILGGILGQEVIKAISRKGDPIKNFFYFDAMEGKGIIEDISSSNRGS